MDRKKEILLLEDDPDHRSILAEGLEEYYDYRVTRAQNVQEAEECLQTIIPDLLLLDCVLGDNRFQVIEWAEQVRRRPALSRAPILFVTAYYQEMEERAREIENADILAKPFTFEDVTQKLQGLLAGKLRSDGARG
jgi:DNA-binding response OmpR family regulator